jgi:hypothetical protein
MVIFHLKAIEKSKHGGERCVYVKCSSGTANDIVSAMRSMKISPFAENFSYDFYHLFSA